MRADVIAAATHLRATAGVERLFATGFCMGGRLTFLAAGFGLDLAGVIGFYGWPTGPSRNGTPAPADVADTFACPVLAIFGGADEGIGPDAVAAFEAALTRAGVTHRVTTYPDAPHSFFDRKATDFAAASAAGVGRGARVHRDGGAVSHGVPEAAAGGGPTGTERGRRRDDEDAPRDPATRRLDEIERDRALLREEALRLDDDLIQRQLRYADVVLDTAGAGRDPARRGRRPPGGVAGARTGRRTLPATARSLGPSRGLRRTRRASQAARPQPSARRAVPNIAACSPIASDR